MIYLKNLEKIFLTTLLNPQLHGIILKNNVHLIFSSKAKVVFNYTGDNSLVHQYFSPFNAGENGFTLENLHLETSRCRYAIHDERALSTEMYINKYLNCNIVHDNTNGGYVQCIGGGLGRNGEIIIKDCYFNNPNASNNDELVSFHNNFAQDQSKSNIVMSGNYFEKGTIRISWCGESQEITDCLISNNKINSNIIFTAERVEDTIHNMKLIEFNNVLT